MSPESVNLNDYAWVRLNDHGWRVHDESYRRLGLDPQVYRDLLTRVGPWQRFQLWELFEMFGPSIQMTAHPLPFEGNELRFAMPLAGDERGEK